MPDGVGPQAAPGAISEVRSTKYRAPRRTLRTRTAKQAPPWRTASGVPLPRHRYPYEAPCSSYKIRRATLRAAHFGLVQVLRMIAAVADGGSNRRFRPATACHGAPNRSLQSTETVVGSPAAEKWVLRSFALLSIQLSGQRMNTLRAVRCASTGSARRLPRDEPEFARRLK